MIAMATHGYGGVRRWALGSVTDKVIQAAREEAAGFVASDGRLRGARLQAALLHLRQRDAGAAQASDMQLARAILAR